MHKDLVETYDAPGHDAAEFNRFALAHVRDVLGARVESPLSCRPRARPTRYRR